MSAPPKIPLFGPHTRDFAKAWGAYTTHRHATKSPGSIPEKDLRAFFNSHLSLYPSDSQIYEMVRCARGEKKARTRSRSSGGCSEEGHLSFGETCVLASELRARCEAPSGMEVMPPLSIMTKKRFNSMVETSSIHPPLKEDSGDAKKSNYDIFLGGSCNPTTWRTALAIPFLKGSALTYYNPQLPNWSPELIQLEHAAKQNSRLLFFVLNEQTRNVVSMIEVSYYAGQRRNLITVLGSYEESAKSPLSFNGESPSKSELEDLSSGLLMVHDLLERENFPVFRDINTALRCAASNFLSQKNRGNEHNISSSNSFRSNEVSSQKTRGNEHNNISNAYPIVKDGRIKIGDEILRLREAFDSLDTSGSGCISREDLKMAFRVHTHKDLREEDCESIWGSTGGSLSFEDFCCVVAEFKREGIAEGVKDCGPLSVSSSSPSLYAHFLAPVSRFFHRVISRSSSCTFPPVKYRRRAGAAFRSRRGSSVRDVYLGGGIEPEEEDWKTNRAIPALKKNGLTYFAPKSPRSRRTPIDFHSIDSSRLLFFYIPGRAKYLPELCEASYYIGMGCNVILCLQAPREEKKEEEVNPGRSKDYARGRSYLSDIANREGIPVFEDLSEGLECLISKCKRS